MKREYFVSRDVPVQLDYDDTYLQPQIDPDGVLRDPYTERDRKLEDLAQEVAYINALKPGRILDVGCGLGFFLSGIDERWERHGQEVSKPCVDFASQFCTAFQGTMQDGDYEDESFDAVVSMSVVEHIPDPIPTVQDMWRVLKPGGHLILRTPNFDSGVARRFGENYRLLQTPGHVTLFSDTSLRRLLEDIGFTIEKVAYPYFETRHFSKENLERLFDTDQISPAFYGNHMSFYATKPVAAKATSWIRKTTIALQDQSEDAANAIEEAGALLAKCQSASQALTISGEEALKPLASAALTAAGINQGDDDGASLSIHNDKIIIKSDAHGEITVPIESNQPLAAYFILNAMLACL